MLSTAESHTECPLVYFYVVPIFTLIVPFGTSLLLHGGIIGHLHSDGWYRSVHVLIFTIVVLLGTSLSFILSTIGHAHSDVWHRYRHVPLFTTTVLLGTSLVLYTEYHISLPQ